MTLSEAGLAPAPLVDWLCDHAPVRPPVHCEPIVGGRSNRTDRLRDDGGRCWVLRRPPAGTRRPGAHDVVREARVVEQIAAATAVPVPTVVGTCDDPTLVGSPFAVSDWVDGLVLRCAADSERLTPSARERASFELVDALAELHRLDPGVLGGDVERARDYFTRQLDRWQEQATSAGVDEPTIKRVGEHLAARLPRTPEAGVVHGDFRLDNAIVGEDGGLRAVVDWELATVGAPLSDVGHIAAYWITDQHRSALYPGTPPMEARGFAPRRELLDRYAWRSGRGLVGLDAATAFAKWKAACAMLVIARRAQMSGSAPADIGTADFPDRARRLLESAAADLEGAQ